MKPSYSFKYNDIQITSNSKIYELEENITVTMEISEYKEFDAIEWVLYFENKSSVNSGVISDINDCDVLLPLDMPAEPKSGYMPKVGDACVITMNGMVDGFNYWENDKVSAQEYQFN